MRTTAEKEAFPMIILRMMHFLRYTYCLSKTQVHDDVVMKRGGWESYIDSLEEYMQQYSICDKALCNGVQRDMFPTLFIFVIFKGFFANGWLITQQTHGTNVITIIIYILFYIKLTKMYHGNSKIELHSKVFCRILIFKVSRQILQVSREGIKGDYKGIQGDCTSIQGEFKDIKRDFKGIQGDFTGIQ